MLQRSLHINCIFHTHFFGHEFFRTLSAAGECHRDGSQHLLEQSELLQIAGHVAVLLGLEEVLARQQLEDHARGGPDVRSEGVGRVEDGLGTAVLARLDVVSELLVVEACVPQIDHLAPNHFSRGEVRGDASVIAPLLRQHRVRRPHRQALLQRQHLQTFPHYASPATAALTRRNVQSGQRAVEVAEDGRGGRQELALGVHQHGVLVGGERELGAGQVDDVEVGNERLEDV